MQKRANETFLRGAFLLALAALVSRLLGALYRIPLYPILGKEGMGLFQMAYPIYGLILTLSTSGVNIAISKLVAEREARGDLRGMALVFRTSLWLLGVSGFVLSVALFGLSRFIADNVAKDPRALMSIAAISPAVFFVSVMSAYRGYFQGQQRMGPTALSQVIEQVIRVATMFSLSLLLLPRGIEFAAAGATFGAVTGSVCGLIYLLWIYAKDGGLPTATTGEQAVSPETLLSVVRKIIEIAIPISLTTGILGLIQLVDLAVVPGRLQASGLSCEEATALYGQLTGGAVPIMNMPTVFTAALQVSLVPAVARAMVGHDFARARSRVSTALRLTFVLMIPASVGLFLLSNEIPSFLYRDPGVGPALAALSSGALFLSLQQSTSGALQGLGHLGVPVRNLTIGAIVKIVATYVLTGIPALGVQGAAYGTVLGFLIASSLNVTALSSRLGPVLDFVAMLVKPVISVSAMAFAVRASYNWLFNILHSGGAATLGAIAVGGGTYGLVLLLIGGVQSSDLHMIPRVGPRIAGILRQMNLIRE